MAFKYIGGFVDEQALRELRLYHWREMIMSMAEVYNDPRTCAVSNVANQTANMHLGFVQTLNDFFPVDDTAEKDNVTA
jgi:hypothetical protein